MELGGGWRKLPAEILLCEITVNWLTEGQTITIMNKKQKINN